MTYGLNFLFMTNTAHIRNTVAQTHNARRLGCTALLLLVLSSLVCNLLAQQYVARELPTQAQLPVASVHCIMQDSEGFMWYGTSGGGLCRDNGYQIDVWRNDARASRHINNNHVTCIVEGTQHQLWFGTQQGLYRIDKTSYTLQQPVKELADRRIDALFADKDGHLWMNADTTVYCCDAQGNILSSCKIQGALNEFYFDGARLWITVWGGGLLAMDGQDYKAGRCRFRPQPWPLDTWPANVVRAHEPDCYWVSTWGRGIGYYEPKANRMTLQPATQGSTAKQQVIDIHIDSDQGILWATTMDDLYAYTIHGQSLQPMPLDKLIPRGNKILDHMAEDRNGNLYVAGFTPHTFILSTDKNQLKNHTVPPMSALTGFPLLADRVVADGDGFWIWQGRIGLTYYHPSTERITHTLRHNYSRHIAQRKDKGGIWADDDRQLFWLWATGDAVHAEPVTTTSESIICLHDTGDGHLWIGTDGAVYRYATISGQLRRVCTTEGKVAAIAVSSRQTVYAILEGKGLWRQEGNGLPHRLDRGGEEFTALTMLNGTTLIAATGQGNVYTLTEGSEELTKDEAMSLIDGNTVKDIKTDRMGHLWILTDQYATEHNPRNHAFRIFRNSNPFINVSYFYSLEPTPDGMLLNGAGAFCEVTSSQALNGDAGQGARPVVTSVVVGDSVRLVGQGQRTLRLPKELQTLTVRLSTLDVMHADKVSYAYRLRGLSDEWITLPQGVNTLTVTALPKGTYTLEAKATDSNGCWGAPRQCLQVVRPPYWYETWWAMCLYALLCVGLCFGLWRLNRRIHWLVTLQRKRKELSLNEISLQPEETNKARMDEQFLRQAISSVEGHLGDTEFNVERFAEEMCMSRMNLYRKLQGQTGLTPSEFIRDIRLKKAASLILNGPKMPIAEVAERVGFASSGHFSKCFKHKFGVLPTGYTGQRAST